MESNEKVYDQRTFDDEPLVCPKCGWKGEGSEANIIGFYGIGKFKQVTCPQCDQLLGSLSRDQSFGEGRPG